MDSSKYLPRITDRELSELLESSGAVLIEGAKWCGKTSSARQIAHSSVFLQDPNRRNTYLQMADTQPSMLLEGETPLLIDEWQDAPVLWDAVRFEVDIRQRTGQFILTGSAVPSDDQVHHTGTGRIARMRMRPMSLYESQDSTGAVSLKNLLDGQHDIIGISHTTVPQIAQLICRGGWPAAISMSPKASLRTARSYVEAVINQDTHRVDGIAKSPDRVRLLLRSLARNISTLATARTIIDDVVANELSMTEKTYTAYLNALKRIYVVEDMPAWQPSIRSKTAIRTSDKRHFVDPSIATAVLRMSPSALLQDFEYFGLLFESLAARDLRIYTEANDGTVGHYRDKSGFEVDMILRLADGRWGAVEVKMGNRQIDEAAANLLKLQQLVNTDKMGQPSLLMVLTAGEMAYRRADGVVVVPLACLKD